MRAVILAIWGIFWTLFFSVTTHLFGWNAVAFHIPIVIAVHSSMEQSRLQTYIVLFILAWVDALLSGGARGPILLAYLALTALLLATRSQWRILHIGQFFFITIAASMIWSLMVGIFLAMMSTDSWWSILLRLSPASAAVTGIFSLFHYVVMHRSDTSQHLDITRRTPLRS